MVVNSLNIDILVTFQSFMNRLRLAIFKAMRPIKFVIIILSTLALTACDELDRVVWSPDGAKVAVLADDGLRLGDASGSLSQATPMKVKLFRWLPDGKRAVIVSEKKTTSWEDLKPLLSKEEVERVDVLGEDLWKYQGDLDNWKYKNEALIFDVPAYLESKYGKEASNAKLKVFGVDSVPESKIYTLQLFNVRQDKVESGAVLLRTTQEIGEVRVSPNGSLLLVSEYGIRAYKLRVIPVDGHKGKLLVGAASQYPDWGPDGKSILCIMGNSPESGSETISLAMLVRLKLSDGGGQMGDPPDTLCHLEFSENDRVRSLPNGEVVFSATESRLPCTDVEFKKRESLYKLSANAQSLLPIPLNGDVLGNDLSHFEINKDGSKAAVAGRKGEITLLDLASGKVLLLEKGTPPSETKDVKFDGGDLKFNPTWRSATELCYPHRTSPSNVEVVLQSIANPDRQSISKNWPPAIGFLTDPKPEPTKVAPDERVPKP
jgi:hypothetical protein